MFSFMRRHLVAYIIGAIVAVALGFGVSYLIGIKGSTPEKVRAERIEAEKRDGAFIDSITGGEDAKASDDKDANSAEDEAAADGKEDASKQDAGTDAGDDGASSDSASASGD